MNIQFARQLKLPFIQQPLLFLSTFRPRRMPFHSTASSQLPPPLTQDKGIYGFSPNVPGRELASLFPCRERG